MRLLRSSSVTPNCARVGGSAGTERNSAGGAVLASRRASGRLPGAIGERVRCVASAAVGLRLSLIDRRGHDGAVDAIGLYVRSLSGRNRRPRAGSGGGPAKRYVRSSTTSTTVKTSIILPRPQDGPGTHRRRRRRSRSRDSCRLAEVWSAIERAPRISAVVGARDSTACRLPAEGRPSGRLPRLPSRAVDVPSALQPTYVVSVVRRGRVDVPAGFAGHISCTCESRRSPATTGFDTCEPHIKRLKPACLTLLAATDRDLLSAPQLRVSYVLPTPLLLCRPSGYADWGDDSPGFPCSAATPHDE